jgi:hypothetical protein
MTPQNEKLVSRVSSAMAEEGDRWFIQSEDGWDHIHRREDWEEDEDSTIVMSIPKGDGDMHFWDARQRAITITALEAAGITLE